MDLIFGHLNLLLSDFGFRIFTLNEFGTVNPGMNNLHGRLLIFTGDGKGKTTAALGMALRAVGHGQRVLILQFIKANDYSGELAALRNFSGVELLQMGRGFLVPPEDPRFEEHRRAAEEALKKAVEILESGRYHLIILDEICTAVKKTSLTEAQVMEAVSHRNGNACSGPYRARGRPRLNGPGRYRDRNAQSETRSHRRLEGPGRG